MKNLLKIAALLSLVSTSAPSFSALVDLSTWTAEGGGKWTLAGDKNSVFQSVNAPPTVFYSPGNSQGKALSGKIKVESGGGNDDDFIGFVLGFTPGDISSASTDFLLIDWKKGNQSNYGVNGPQGLAISRVTGGLPDTAASWGHTGKTVELQRGSTLGSKGWQYGVEYAFDLIFTATAVQVIVNGITELSIAGAFSDGSFGFYNNSQESVRYSSIEEDVAPPIGIPEPMTLTLLGIGMLGLSAARRKKAI